MAAVPEAIVDFALGGWGSPSAVFPLEVLKSAKLTPL
jgi:hypothetical protein